MIGLCKRKFYCSLFKILLLGSVVDEQIIYVLGIIK